MADFEAIGKALQIPQSVLNNIEKIDQKINLIASDSEKMATHFMSAMTRMGTGADGLLKKLQSIQVVINGLGNVNIGGLGSVSKGMGSTATQAEKAAASISQAASALNRFVETWKGSGRVTSMLDSLATREQVNLLRELNNQAMQTSRTLTQANRENALSAKQRANETKIASQEETNATNRKMAALKQENAQIKINSAEYRNYVSALTMSESSENSRLKKIERMSTVLSDLQRKESLYANEIEVVRKKIEQLTRENDSLARSREKTKKQNIDERANTQALNAYNRAMSASEALVTQRINKIAKLRQAEEILRNASGNYATQLNRINQEIARLNRLNEGQVDSYGRVIRSQRNLVNTSQQLTRQLALLFSVSQIEGYISKLIQVRGEFELQNTALASILQNKDQADRLFAQITELAVRSPFTVKELTTYTKSLSAYQVQYEDLYDTTKMLADVSAGLGVDMQRLILVFGQVKAANILRGTEVRQFTEAGLNILGELAKYYSELEGRMISVGEVQDMVTRRMVSFGDVEEVFKRVTSEGGIFYDMQERQAETLAGMMSNLQDRIDLMLNQIGKDNQETIKSVISFIGNLLENYDAVVAAIQAAGGAFVLYKLNVLEANKVLIRYAVQQNIVTAGAVRQLSLIQLLRVGFLRLSTALKTAGAAMKAFAASNVWLLALTAIGTAIYEIVTWNNELNEQLDGINKKYNEQSASLIKVSEAYKEVTKRAKEATSAQSGEDIYKEQFAQLQKLNEMLEDRGYRLPIHIELVTPDNIDEAFASGQEMLQLANDFSAEFQKALAVETNAAEGWFNIFGDNLASDLKDLSDSYSQVGGSFKANLDILENEVIVASKGLQGAARGYYEELRKGQKENETDTEWTMRRLTLISDINDLIRISNNSTRSGIQHERLLNQLLSTRTEILENEREVQYELDKVMNDLINKYGGIDNLKKQFNDNPLVIRTEIDRAFEQMELDAQTKRFAAHWAANRLQIPIEFTEQAEMPTFYNDWRDTVKAIDTSGIFEKQLQSMSDITDLESALQKAYSNAVKELDVYNRANADRLDLTKQIEEQEEKLLSSNADEAAAAQLTIKNLKEQRDLITQSVEKGKEQSNNTINTVKALAAAFNLNYLSPTGGGSKNPELDKLKEQVAMIEKAAKAYEDYRKLYDEETAQRMVETAFAKPFENLDLNFAMTFDAQGIIEAYRKLAQSVGGDAQEYIEGKIAEGLTDVTTEQRTKEVEEYRKQIDELFAYLSNYQELEKLGLNKDLISQLFGIDVSSINDVQTAFDKMKNILKGYGDDGENLIAEAEKKITDVQQKELNDRLTRYAQMLKKSISERARIELEAQREIAKIQDTQGMTQPMKDASIQNVRQQANAKISQLDWQDFQNSDVYTQLFQDLEYVSTSALKRIKENLDALKDSMSNLTPEQLKSINEYYSKLEEQLSTRNPFAAMRDSLIEIRALQSEGRTEEVINQELLNYEAQAELYKTQIEDLETIIGMKQEGISLDSLSDDLLQRNADILDKTTDELRLKLSLRKGKLNQVQTDIGISQKDLNSYGKARKDADILGNTIKEIGSLGKQAFGSISSILDSMGVSMGENEDAVGGLIDGFLNIAMQLGQLAILCEIFGVALNAALGPIGWAVMALQALTSIFTAFSKIHDNKREQQIEKEQEAVEYLEKAYDKLYDTIENGLSIYSYSDNSKLIDNLRRQVESYQRMIAAEQDKKKTDEDRIKEWEDAIDDIYSQIDELYNNIKEDLVGNFKDVSSQLAEALVGAFESGEDAAEAWGNSVRDIMVEILTNILTMKFIEPAVQEILDNMFEQAMPQTDYASKIAQQLQDARNELAQMEADMSNGFRNQKWYSKKAQLEKEIQQLEKEYDKANQAAEGEIPTITDDIVNSTAGQLNDLLESVVDSPIADLIKQLYGQSGAGGDTLTGLQRGIEGLSEQTGQALEALLESCRYFISDSNIVLHNFYNAFQTPNEENPFLAELRNQTSLIQSINNTLSRLTRNATSNGLALKVQIV